MMESLAQWLDSAGRLVLVVLGFSLIVCLHELGHFLAARWAGIRVLAFAIGFGPAIVSWRKGLGWRRGSSEDALRRHALDPAGESGPGPGVSPTEYRINWIPFGGYVKMLGQEDLHPGAISGAPDSYSACPVWKRMIVISAGVIMNLVTAAALFVVVFSLGLSDEPPEIGAVVPRGPADRARAADPTIGPGLRAGDRLLAIRDRAPMSFDDLVIAAAMTRPGDALPITIAREGAAGPIAFTLVPRFDALRQVLDVGAVPARALELFDPDEPALRAALGERLEQIGWRGVEPGMRLVEVAGRAARRPGDLARAIRDSGGQSVRVAFARGDRRVDVDLETFPELMHDLVETGARRFTSLDHLLGLTPLMLVDALGERGRAQGLREGDVFLRIGDIDYPSLADGIPEIRRHAGGPLAVEVERRDAAGRAERVALEVEVAPDGRIGFTAGTSAFVSARLARTPVRLYPRRGALEPFSPAAGRLGLAPGSTVAAVAGRATANLGEVRAALRAALEGAWRAGEAAAVVELAVRAPEGAERLASWTLKRREIEALFALEWTTSPYGGAPIASWWGLFAPTDYRVVAGGPVEAIAMGVGATKQFILVTYLTILRLVQGSIALDQLKGPIGIAHLGTLVADRGLIELLFFMALISVNLAVINFLPLPIVDGGQFLFLLVEQIQGRPVSIRVQNAATIAGLVLIGAVFLLVTYNDIISLFRGS